MATGQEWETLFATWPNKIGHSVLCDCTLGYMGRVQGFDDEYMREHTPYVEIEDYWNVDVMSVYRENDKQVYIDDVPETPEQRSERMLNWITELYYSLSVAVDTQVYY